MKTIAARKSETTWEGPLASGSGTIRGTSGALSGLHVTWASRTEEPGGVTIESALQPAGPGS